MLPLPKIHYFAAGVTVNTAFVTTPVCCPARSALYTGKYIHNIGVFNNSAGSGGCSSLAWQNGPEKFNIAWWLKGQLNYTTSFAGKYMNNYGYGSSPDNVQALPQCLNETYAWENARETTTCSQRLEHIPRGWDNWQVR